MILTMTCSTVVFARVRAMTKAANQKKSDVGVLSAKSTYLQLGLRQVFMQNIQLGYLDLSQ